MTRRSRRACAAIIAALTATALSGCAISATGPDEPGKTTLTFWQYFQGTQKDWIEGQVARFEKANPDVDVRLIDVVGDQQDQKLLASVATGSTPDLFINNIVVDFPTLVGGGVAKDLTPYWRDFAAKDEFPDNAVWRSDGRIYNLMSYNNLIGMYYNEDILKAVGIDSPPTTLSELQADLKTVAADGRYRGLAMSGAPTVEGAWLFAPQLLGEGVNYCNFSGSKVDAAFDRMHDWARAGYLPQATATWDQNAAWQQFMTGKYAFGLNGNWQLGNVQTADFAYGTTQYPAPDGGRSIVYPGGEGFGIGALSKHPDLAWRFIEQVILSKQGGTSVYKAAGSIPLRSDAADVPAIRDDAMVQPFVAATKNTGDWPDNTSTADMQTALGKAISATVSGQTTAGGGAEQATSEIAAIAHKGIGSCR